MRTWHSLLLLGVLTSAGCSFDLSTNPNSPDPIGADPSRNEIAVAANGVLIAFRTDFADFPLDMGILGREVLRFDGSDPRFTGELMLGPLDPGSDAFGGDHWADQYAAIRGGNLILAVLPSASLLTAEEQSATSGYVKTHPGAELPDHPEFAHPGFHPDRHRHVGDGATGRLSGPGRRCLPTS